MKNGDTSTKPQGEIINPGAITDEVFGENPTNLEISDYLYYALQCRPNGAAVLYDCDFAKAFRTWTDN